MPQVPARATASRGLLRRPAAEPRRCRRQRQQACCGDRQWRRAGGRPRRSGRVAHPLALPRMNVASATVGRAHVFFRARALGFCEWVVVSTVGDRMTPGGGQRSTCPQGLSDATSVAAAGSAGSPGELEHALRAAHTARCLCTQCNSAGRARAQRHRQGKNAQSGILRQ